MGTTFYVIYCSFLDRITDDMYMEMTMEETFESLESLLMASVSKFKFPRFPIFRYDREYEALHDDEGNLISTGAFETEITIEEINILADIMLIEWFQRQLATTRLVKQRYSGPDFKLTSQASHLQRLQGIIDSKTKENNRMQSLYGRRIQNEDGMMVPNYENLYSYAAKIYSERAKGTLSTLEGGEHGHG